MASERQRLPSIIAHRGASGYRPENTLAAFDLAIDLGADALEFDVVMSKDRRLVVRHDRRLAGTTDVALRRADDPCVEDLTIEDLRELRAVERWPELRPGSARHDRRYGIAMLGEVLAMVRRKETRLGRRIGLHIELKDAESFRELGLPMEPRLLTVLERSGALAPDRTVYLQSFEPGVLVRLAEETEIPLMQMMTEECDSAEFDEIARYASAVGPAKDLLTAELVSAARDRDLRSFPFTYRADRGNFEAELKAAFDLGVDGIFTDHPDLALRARAGWAGD